MVTIPTIDQISGSTVMRKMRDLINHFITFAGEVDEELTTIENSFDNYYTKVEVDGNFYTKTYINTNYYDKTSVDYLLTRKADVFALGNGLIWYENQLFAKIDGTTITFDSSGRLKANVDTSNFYTKTETDNLLDDKQDALTAGTGISITNDVISATNVFDPTQYYNKTTTDDLLDDKQNVLTAGTGITITNDVISATGGSSGEWRIINSLSEIQNSNYFERYPASNTYGRVKKDFIMYLYHATGNEYYKGVTIPFLKGTQLTLLNSYCIPTPILIRGLQKGTVDKLYTDMYIRPRANYSPGANVWTLEISAPILDYIPITSTNITVDGVTYTIKNLDIANTASETSTLTPTFTNNTRNTSTGLYYCIFVKD